MRLCKQRRKVLRAILNMKRKRAIKARKLAKKIEVSGSTNAQMKRLDEIMNRIRKEKTG